MKPYFAFFVGEGISVTFFPLFEPFVNVICLVVVPVLVYRKRFEELGVRNFKKGFLYGISAFVFLPFINLIYFPVALIDAFSQELFFKGFFYSVFENEYIFWKISRLNLISSFLYFLIFLTISRSLFSFSYFLVSIICGVLYEESDSIVAPFMFHLGFFLSKFSGIWR
ncbi:CPBP family glutamic-type intramembrane protease [Desulfurobacterium indicum]|nr:CPBP family glutamic-type intramembrane protease [Desulfurobacterium indicum]